MSPDHEPVRYLRVTAKQLPLVVEFQTSKGERKVYEISSTRKLGLLMQKVSSNVKGLLSPHSDG